MVFPTNLKSMGFEVFLEYMDSFDIVCQALLHFTWKHKIQATEEQATEVKWKLQLLPSLKIKTET